MPPTLTLICPPRDAADSCILREGNARQVWQPVVLDAHQLDYWSLENLWPGWRVYGHEGRYLSERTVRILNWATMERPEENAPLPR